MKVTKSTLEKLRNFVLEREEFNDADVAELLNLRYPEQAEEVKALGVLLRKTYPDDFGYPESEEAAPKIYQLKDEKGFLHDLEVFREKDERVVLQRKVPSDIVRIIVRGEDVEVDLYRLKQLAPTESMHGVTVARLIELAEIAKA